MGFDYRKFESNASIGSLVRLGCSRELLKYAACRYAIASGQPGELRRGLARSGVTYKQLRAKAAEARGLAGFLRRLSDSPRIVAANDLPKTPIPVWCKDLQYIARWVESLGPFRPDPKEAALALALHVGGATGQRHLAELVKLLNAALSAAGLTANLTPERLRKQIARANPEEAETILRFWESVAPPPKN